MFYYLAKLFFQRWIRTGRYRLRLLGQASIPVTGPIILAANHAGPWDGPYIAQLTDRKIWFMMRSSDGFARWAKFISAIPINKGEADRSALLQAAAKLSQGHPLGMMVLGHSQKDDPKALPQRGICFILRQQKCPVTVIPVGVHWHNPPGESPIIAIVCGEPIEVCPPHPKQQDAAWLTQLANHMRQARADAQSLAELE